MEVMMADIERHPFSKYQDPPLQFLMRLNIARGGSGETCPLPLLPNCANKTRNNVWNLTNLPSSKTFEQILEIVTN